MEVLKIPLGRTSVLLEGEKARMLHEKIGFDSYFWKCGHDLIPHTVANEFPMWTYLFADLHAHMIVIPFTILLIGLAAALFANPGRALASFRGNGLRPPGRSSCSASRSERFSASIPGISRPRFFCYSRCWS